MKPLPNKPSTHASDVAAWVSYQRATEDYRSALGAAKSRLESAIESGQTTLDLESANRAWKQLENAETAVRKIPMGRRELAKDIARVATQNAVRCAHVGAEYSGKTRYVGFVSPDAETWAAATAFSEGAQYSRRCKFHKLDATHEVILSPADAVSLYRLPDGLLELSAAEGLPLVTATPDPVLQRDSTRVFECVWAVTVGKRVGYDRGFIAWTSDHGGVAYHTTAGSTQAFEGLRRKVIAFAEDLRRREATRSRRREAIAALQNAETVTIPMVREATGWCEPGCIQFSEKHLDGKREVGRADLISRLRTIQVTDRPNKYVDRLLTLISPC